MLEPYKDIQTGKPKINYLLSVRKNKGIATSFSSDAIGTARNYYQVIEVNTS